MIVHDVKEWISDNLRYILLGAAILLVVAIIVLTVRLIGGSSEGTAGETESESHSAAVVIDTEAETFAEQALPLVKDDEKILAIVTQYYAALESKDIEGLRGIVESLNEESEQEILNNNIIESYRNISVYSKAGPEEGTYVVYTYYEGKLAGVETLAPGLSSLYLRTNEEGNLYVADAAAVAEYINNVSAGADVKALIQEVEEKCAAAEATDPALASALEALKVPETEVVIPDADSVGVSADKQVVATDVCNVRADSTEEAEILGMLAIGEKVTRIRELENGWSEVRYGSGTAYIKSDYLKEE